MLAFILLEQEANLKWGPRKCGSGHFCSIKGAFGIVGVHAVSLAVSTVYSMSNINGV
jgi:hypothetical protein